VNILGPSAKCLEMQLACSDIDHYKLNCVLYYVTDCENVEEKNPATVMGHCCYGSSSRGRPSWKIGLQGS